MSVFDDIEKKERDFNQNIFDELFGAKLEEYKQQLEVEVKSMADSVYGEMTRLLAKIHELEYKLERKVDRTQYVIHNAPPPMIIEKRDKQEWDSGLIIGSYLTERCDAPEYSGDTTVDVGCK